MLSVNQIELTFNDDEVKQDKDCDWQRLVPCHGVDFHCSDLKVVGVLMMIY